MSGAQSISARRAYGVHRVCRVWGRARSSVYVRRPATRSRASRRRGPVGAATDEVLVGHIRRVLEASPFHGEGCFRHQLLLPRPYLVLTKPLRLDIQCQRGASVKIGWKYLDD